jgi:hypothetical protein
MGSLRHLLRRSNVPMGIKYLQFYDEPNPGTDTAISFSSFQAGQSNSWCLQPLWRQQSQFFSYSQAGTQAHQDSPGVNVI